MDDARWPTDWLRGALEVCTLGVLADGPAHGYAVAQRLEAADLGQVKGGTLYPLLTRLETAGLLVSQWEAGSSGPGRKVFTLTDDGREELARRSELWLRFTEVTGSLLQSPSRSTPTWRSP